MHYERYGPPLDHVIYHLSLLILAVFIGCHGLNVSDALHRRAAHPRETAYAQGARYQSQGHHVHVVSLGLPELVGVAVDGPDGYVLVEEEEGGEGDGGEEAEEAGPGRDGEHVDQPGAAPRELEGGGGLQGRDGEFLYGRVRV